MNFWIRGRDVSNHILPLVRARAPGRASGSTDRLLLNHLKEPLFDQPSHKYHSATVIEVTREFRGREFYGRGYKVENRGNVRRKGHQFSMEIEPGVCVFVIQLVIHVESTSNLRAV